MSKVALTARERREIRAALRQTRDARLCRRLVAVLEYDRGLTASEIAELLGVSGQSVYNWIARFQEQGDASKLSDAPRSERPARTGEVVDGLLRAADVVAGAAGLSRNALDRSPVAGPLAAEHGGAVFVGHGTSPFASVRVGGNATALRPGARPAAREKKRQICRAVSGLPKRSVVLAEDETDLLLFPPLRAMWSPRGEPARVMLSGWNARRVVFGCINLVTGHRLFQVRHHQRADDRQAFLHHIRRQYRGWQINWVLDGNSSHTANASQALAARLKIRLLWLPKRAPELNPMDTLWGQGKDAICTNKQYTSIDDQAESFIAHLSHLSDREALQTSGILSDQFWLKQALSKHFCGPA